MSNCWMQTAAGIKFDLLEPDPGMVSITDIAKALGNICRFAGHTGGFYSVAEHSVLVSRAMERKNALWGLLHDATEAYVGDLLKSLKIRLPEYRRIEKGILDAVVVRFKLQPYDMPYEVRMADKKILRDEKQQLLSKTSFDNDWCYEYADPLGVVIKGWGPQQAASEFLTRYYEVK